MGWWHKGWKRPELRALGLPTATCQRPVLPTRWGAGTRGVPRQAPTTTTVGARVWVVVAAAAGVVLILFLSRAQEGLGEVGEM